VPDRRADRLRALRGRLAEEGLDALVVSHPANVRYLTGFSGSSGLVMVTERAVLFLTDFRYQTQVAEEVGDLARIEIDSAGFLVRLLKLLPEYLQVRMLGFEAHVLTVRDAARAFRLALERYDAPEPLNIGSGEEISIRELAGVVAELTGFTGTIEWDRSRPNGQPRRRLDVERARDAIGFEATIPLRAGLEEIVASITERRRVTKT